MLVENCITFSADKNDGVASVLKEALENLIVVGCPCHLISLAAEKGAACIPAKFDEVLMDIYYLEKNAKTVPDPRDSYRFGRCAGRSPARSPKIEGAKRQGGCNASRESEAFIREYQTCQFDP
ncbi:hypothetical protein HPB50_008839 [Hyalomma asiaticum]|uniref:Uncharacterized protein n=1 Tax=Hyalomma asiaticum TaxID=266040 RepID=A0ACB7RIC3_HYAAI|nr:hypothetical protein HPB50_008839 [Hyalomma asiaticum]